MNPLERVHDTWQIDRRVELLAAQIEPLLPRGASVLDVGSGDGRLATALCTARPDLHIEGVDVLERPAAHIPVRVFDGRRLPCNDDSYDTLLFVDVIHHAEDPVSLLRESCRAARRHLVIKDHLLEGFLAGPTLGLMDRVGNARHGVALPQTYWPESRWRDTWTSLALELDHFETRLGLYPPPLGWIFDRRLHFLARLGVAPDADVVV